MDSYDEEVKSQISTSFSDNIGVMLNVVDKDLFLKNATAQVIQNANKFYKICFNSETYIKHYNLYKTRSINYYLRYPYSLILTDPMYSDDYFTFDRDGNPYYIRYITYSNNWDFITESNLTRDKICFNYFMIERMSSQTYERNLKMLPERFYFYNDFLAAGYNH